MADITISEQEINNMTEQVMDKLAGSIGQFSSQQDLLMKKFALDFLLVAKQNEKRMKEIEQRAKILKNKRDALGFSKGKAPNEQKLKEYNNYKQQLNIQAIQKDQFSNFFQACLKFNENILSLIEGKNLISVVVEGAEGPVILDLTLQDFLKQGGKIKADISSKGKIVGRFNLSAIQAQRNLSMALKGDTVLDNTSLDQLTTTYKMAKQDYQKHSPYAFWKIKKTDRWKAIKIAGGQGDIAQAYSMFAHTWGPTTEVFGSFYNNLDVFFRQGVAQVDNISGLYTSDVTSNGYSLAVKAANASLPGFTQMITLAEQIIKGQIKTVEQLKTEAERKKGFKDGVKKNLKYGLRNKIYESATQLPKSVNPVKIMFNFD